MPDVADPHVYLAGVAAILDEYPQAVRDQISDPRTGTRLLKRFPLLHDIREACDVAYEPIERALERERAAQSHRLSLPPPKRSDEDQARIDARVAEVRTELGITGDRRRQWNAPPSADQDYYAPVLREKIDGKHYGRIAADLQARKARNEHLKSDSPSDSKA